MGNFIHPSDQLLPDFGHDLWDGQPGGASPTEGAQSPITPTFADVSLYPGYVSLGMPSVDPSQLISSPALTDADTFLSEADAMFSPFAQVPCMPPPLPLSASTSPSTLSHMSPPPASQAPLFVPASPAGPPPSQPPATPRTPRNTRRSASGLKAAPKKTAHNMIEKRYRNNLNDRIKALYDAVPTVRVAARRQGRGDDPADALSDEELLELDGLKPAGKLSKAIILAKAEEYITHLEGRNTRLLERTRQLEEEIADLKGRLGEA